MYNVNHLKNATFLRFFGLLIYCCHHLCFLFFFLLYSTDFLLSFFVHLTTLPLPSSSPSLLFSVITKIPPLPPFFILFITFLLSHCTVNPLPAEAFDYSQLESCVRGLLMSSSEHVHVFEENICGFFSKIL